MTSPLLKQRILLLDIIPIRRLSLHLMRPDNSLAPIRPATPVAILLYVHGEPGMRLYNGVVATSDIGHGVSAVDAGACLPTKCENGASSDRKDEDELTGRH